MKTPNQFDCLNEPFSSENDTELVQTIDLGKNLIRQIISKPKTQTEDQRINKYHKQ